MAKNIESEIRKFVKPLEGLGALIRKREGFWLVADETEDGKLTEIKIWDSTGVEGINIPYGSTNIYGKISFEYKSRKYVIKLEPPQPQSLPGNET